MRTKLILLWVVVIGLGVLVVVGQPQAQAAAAWQTRQSAKPLAQAYYGSGVVVSANIGVGCSNVSWWASCTQRPYLGVFVVTELNGAVVTYVMTNEQGQAMVDLPPGRYLIGAQTENIYPRAAPVIVNVLANRYAYVAFQLDAGAQMQAAYR